TKQELNLYLKKRREGTPFDQPCCGSVFRNPTAPVPSTPPAPPAPPAPSPPVAVPTGAGGAGGAGGARGAGVLRTAGQLIDACGLKGFRIGGAEVSPLHANYIVNLGTATAAQVRSVIEAVRERVRERFGVELELEVKILGA
ncbi:MAG: hypothetical protein HY560_00330, partial [Gemmatimonadetes bacterium]|nr:hypothetical protein [Gemmatimonadota bacterium]